MVFVVAEIAEFLAAVFFLQSGVYAFAPVHKFLPSRLNSPLMDYYNSLPSLDVLPWNVVFPFLRADPWVLNFWHANFPACKTFLPFRTFSNGANGVLTPGFSRSGDSPPLSSENDTKNRKYAH